MGLVRGASLVFNQGVEGPTGWLFQAFQPYFIPERIAPLFLFYENWENRLLWEQHMDSAHIQAFRKRTEGWLENLEILLMQPEKPAS